MIDSLTIGMIIIALILCAIMAWLYLKKPEKKPKKVQIKQEYTPSYQTPSASFPSIEKKTGKKPMKPFHPELLTDYKINSKSGATSFKGNAKTSEEIRDEQRKNDWNN